MHNPGFTFGGRDISGAPSLNQRIDIFPIMYSVKGCYNYL